MTRSSISTAIQEFITRALQAHQDAATLTVRQRHDELTATDAELAKTEAAVERYMHAFEAGTLTADIFAERVPELGTKAKLFAPDRQNSPR